MDDHFELILLLVALSCLIWPSVEVLPLTTFVLGLYAFLIEKERVVGLMTMLASARWFGLAVFVIIPHFSPDGPVATPGGAYRAVGTAPDSRRGPRLAGYVSVGWPVREAGEA